jgi:hypothetical protein
VVYLLLHYETLQMQNSEKAQNSCLAQDARPLLAKRQKVPLGSIYHLCNINRGEWNLMEKFGNGYWDEPKSKAQHTDSSVELAERPLTIKELLSSGWGARVGLAGLGMLHK